MFYIIKNTLLEMPKKATQPASTVPATPVSVVAEAVAEVQKSVSRSSKKKEVATPAPVVQAPVQEAESQSAEDASSGESRKRSHRVPTVEDVDTAFGTLLTTLDTEVETLRASEDKGKSKVVRLLRSVAKQVRQLRSDSLRLASKKARRTTAPRSTNSGFMKPVKISRDMQNFTGMKDDVLVSRVDVTKSICQYVKDHNLQNENDRRQFTPDAKLAKLLGTKEPLTYYALQQHIQPHFIKQQ